jgi:hypothetical protein
VKHATLLSKFSYFHKRSNPHLTNIDHLFNTRRIFVEKFRGVNKIT